MNADPEFLKSVYLSFQRALWDMVTPDLRVVAVQVDDHIIRARFGYDQQPTESRTELVSIVETEVVADFLPGVVTEFTTEFVPMGTSRLFEGDWRWIYLRREQVDPEP